MKRNEMTFARRSRASACARRGALLVMVLYFLVLVGSMAVLIMGNTSQLARTTRHAHEMVLLRQLVDSGKAWADAQAALLPGVVTTLSGSGILPPDATGAIRITRPKDAPDAILVTAELNWPGRKLRKESAFHFPR